MLNNIRLTIIIIILIFCADDVLGVRIKDIADIKGIRYNQLLGYGLVVGLNGTGDKQGTEFTIQSVSAMLSKMGIVTDPDQIKVKNIAAVMVTAKLPPFIKAGSNIDVVVSSIGDASSLQGGTLLLTPLYAPDNKVYAVAQGPISVGGFIGSAGGNTVQKNHPTVGKIMSGAIVEKEVEVDINNRDKLIITFHQQDFTTTFRISQAINRLLGKSNATPLDSGTIELLVPEQYKNRIVEMIALIEVLDIPVDTPARIVVNERTGTIVMGENVRISTVAISHGNLTIQIKTELQVSQPEPFSKGETVVLPQSNVEVKEQDAKLLLLKQGVNIGEVVKALNAIGVTPRDLIAILQSIKAAGALHATLEII
ncbi:MAG: flagellar basal body P-ring protein FlgI [Nitrospirota bacterium]